MSENTVAENIKTNEKLLEIHANGYDRLVDVYKEAQDSIARLGVLSVSIQENRAFIERNRRSISIATWSLLLIMVFTILLLSHIDYEQRNQISNLHGRITALEQATCTLMPDNDFCIME